MRKKDEAVRAAGVNPVVFPQWLGGVAIFLTVALAYFPALRGGFLWDDDGYVSNNESLRTWHGLWQIWFQPGATEQFYPLSFTVFWLEYHLWGLNTAGYHAVNILMHGLASVLLWQVLERLRVRGAWLAGAIFALHPVNVMSVAWITELKNTLSGCLALGAGWAYLRFAGLGIYAGKSTARPEWKWYALALVLFSLAMLAKTAVSFFPVTLLLILWWQRGRVSVREVLWLLPMVGISLGMGLLTISVEQHTGGASGSGFKLGLIERLLISGHSFWFYLGKLLFPYPLVFIYPRWSIDASAWTSYLYPLATAALLAGLWMARKRLGRGVCAAFLHFYMTTSLLVLIVVLYMMRYTFVSDHWQYFGAMSMVALLAAGLTEGLDWFGPGGRLPALVLKAGLLLTLGTLSWQRASLYSSMEPLWIDTLYWNTSCWMAHINLGNILVQRGEVQKGMEHYQAALALAPNEEEAHYDLGNLFLREGRNEEAIAEYQTALTLKPDYLKATANMAAALLQAGRVDDAIAEYEKAVELNPDLAETHYDLGLAFVRRNQMERAMEEFQKTLELNPAHAQAHNNLGSIYLQQANMNGAIAEFQRAIQIDPGLVEAQRNLGLALAQIRALQPQAEPAR